MCNISQNLVVPQVLLRIGPEKPIRTMTEAEHHAFLSQLSESSSATPSPSQAQGFLETSFTSTVAVRQPPTGGPLRNELARSWDHAAEQILHSQVITNKQRSSLVLDFIFIGELVKLSARLKLAGTLPNQF